MLRRPGIALAGSRRSSVYGARVAEIVAKVAADRGAAVWVRLSPSGAERAAVGAAWEAGVPVVALAASPLEELPADRVDEVLDCGGVVASVWNDASGVAAAARARDAALGRCAGVLVPIDDVDAPDVGAVIDAAVLGGVPLVVARPRVGHRRGPEAALTQALSLPGRSGRVRVSAEASSRLARHEIAANSVCDTPEQLEAVLGFCVAWHRSATPGR